MSLTLVDYRAAEWCDLLTGQQTALVDISRPVREATTKEKPVIQR